MTFKAYSGITAVLFGLIALLTAPTAQGAAKPDDCNRVAKADRSLCQKVKAQHAYGWTDSVGNPQNWLVNGRLLVREITHQGYTKAEMRDALQGAQRDYRAYVTDVSFNMDTITRECGHTHGAGGVQYVSEHGRLYTWKIVVCD